MCIIYISMLATDILRLLGLGIHGVHGVMLYRTLRNTSPCLCNVACSAGQFGRPQTPCRDTATLQNARGKVTPDLYRYYIFLHRLYTYYIPTLYNMYTPRSHM